MKHLVSGIRQHKLNEQWAPMNSHELLWTSKPMQLINTFCSVGFACLDVKYVLIGRVSLPKSVCWFRWVREGTCGAWFWGIERHARRSNNKKIKCSPGVSEFCFWCFILCWLGAPKTIHRYCCKTCFCYILFFDVCVFVSMLRWFAPSKIFVLKCSDSP